MQSTIQGTQSTSIDAIKTKACCVNKKYLSDDFVSEMDKSLPQNKVFLPLINRGTFSRIHSIQSTVQAFVANLTEEKNVNVISLGCGYDTLAFNLIKAGYANVSYYELDYDEIVNKKAHLIQSSTILTELLEKHQNYHLCKCDIADMKQLKDLLEQISKDDFTIVICECILVYLTRDKSIEILSALKSRFTNCVVLEYDLIKGNDPFGREMIENLKMRSIELRGFDSVNSTEDQMKRLKECGFDKGNVIDMHKYYYSCIPKEEIKRIEALEMMDELEEFILLQDHSCFGYGYSFSNDKFTSLIQKVMKF